MNLEKRVHNKFGLFKRITKKVMPYIFATGLGLAAIGCVPGPISVENKITPIVVSSGDDIYWEVKVTNYGSKAATISQAKAHEKAISGWAAGYYDFTVNLPITDNEINAHSTETIFGMSIPVLNTGPDDVMFENTVTIDSDGGNDSDTCTYTIRSIYSKGLKEKEFPKEGRGAVKGLLEYMK